MNCIIHASLDDLVKMTYEQYQEYMEDQFDTVRYGYTVEDAVILRRAIKRTQVIRHEEKKKVEKQLLAEERIVEKELLAEEIMRAKKSEVRKTAQQTRREREKVSKDRDFDLYRPRIVVPEIDYHDFHHEKIPYTPKELQLPRDMRAADLKHFLSNTVHLSRKSVDFISSQIPRALEVLLGMTDVQIRQDISRTRIYAPLSYVVQEHEFTGIFVALNRERQNVRQRERQKVELHRAQDNDGTSLRALLRDAPREQVQRIDAGLRLSPKEFGKKTRRDLDLLIQRAGLSLNDTMIVRLAHRRVFTPEAQPARVLLHKYDIIASRTPQPYVV